MDFQARYRRECLLSGTSPLHAVESHLADGVLDLKYFRVPVSEWVPLLAALASDTTLKKITIRIDYTDHTVPNPNHRAKLKHLDDLCRSLCASLSRTTTLRSLQLTGLPLSAKGITELAAVSAPLKHPFPVTTLNPAKPSPGRQSQPTTHWTT